MIKTLSSIISYSRAFDFKGGIFKSVSFPNFTLFNLKDFQIYFNMVLFYVILVLLCYTWGQLSGFEFDEDVIEE